MNNAKINNGFNFEEDYNYVLNIVKNAIGTTDKVHTYGVYMDDDKNINIVINDIRVTECGLDSIKFIYDHNLPISEISCARHAIANIIKKHLFEVMKSEGLN